MNETKHVPTPWRLGESYATPEPAVRILSANGLLVAMARAAAGPMTWARDHAKIIVEAVNQHDQLVAENARLRKALDTFARIANIVERLNLPDDEPLRNICPGTWPTLQDCRAARAALAQTEGK